MKDEKLIMRKENITASEIIEAEERLGREIQDTMCRFLEPLVMKIISIIDKNRGNKQ